jgi:DNA polymerase elongation subunit (family B)
MFSYIYFSRSSNKIHSWEYNDRGEKIHVKDDAPLYFYVKSDSKTDYKSIFGDYVRKMEFDSWGKYKETREMYQEANRKMFESDVDIETKYIMQKWAGMPFKPPVLDIFFIDIEVHSEVGFPNAEEAKHPITIITIYSTKQKKYFVFAEKEFDTNIKDIKGRPLLTSNDEIFICRTEEALLKKFITVINNQHPDIITGWNITRFDIPYIINRAKQLLSENMVNKLSPIGYIRERIKQVKFGKGNVKETKIYEIVGINIIEYIDLYKKYTQKEQPSFKLDYIASKVEKVGAKLEYEGSLKDLYNNDWQRYCEYNIQDVNLLNLIEIKNGFLQLLASISYGCLVQFENFEKTTKVLDGAFLSKLYLDHIILPDCDRSAEGEYEGAFVRDPVLGCHDWVVSYDAASLYPSIMMMHNISPETKVRKCFDFIVPYIMKALNGETLSEENENKIADNLGNTVKNIIDLIKTNKYSIATNGAVYDQSKTGIVPKFVKEWFEKRKYHKKKQFECHDSGDHVNENLHKLLQKNYKILINSVYGYVGSKFSRLFDIDNALAVTSTGQQAIVASGDALDNYFKNNWELSNIGKSYNAKNINDGVMIYQDTDSIAGGSIVTLEDGKKLQIKELFNVLGNENFDTYHIDSNGREYIIPDKLTLPYYDEESKIIKYGKVEFIERHFVKKKMYRIKTKSGKYIDVTEDHSCMILVNDILKQKTPKEITPGDKIICIK